MIEKEEIMHAVETAPAQRLTPGDEAAIRAIVGELEARWNAADGAAYGAHFAEDADFVNVFGHYYHGRATIAAGHQRIFDTVYRGSRNSGAVEAIRAIAPGVALALVAWHLRIPTNEGEREARARNTIVLTKGAEGWRIAAFHNTPIVEHNPAGEHGPRA
jgi:uncharacterized protein (TIGR02246 family)